MMSVHERDMTEIRMSVSKLERDHLMAYIDDLRAQRCEASPMESDYLAEVIQLHMRRLMELELDMANHEKKLEVDRWDRQHHNIFRIH